MWSLQKFKDIHSTKVNGWKTIFHESRNQKKAGVSILRQIDLKEKKKKPVMRNKDVYILIKRSVQQEDITIDIYAPNIRSVQFSPSVVSNSLLPHGLQHVRFPCPSPTPRACANSGPLESVMPYNHFILCPLLLLPSLFPSIRVFSNESVLDRKSVV